MKRIIAATMSLLIPVLSSADLTNTAQVSYQDASGSAHTAASNTVTVTVGSLPPPPPSSSPPPKIDSMDCPHVMPVNGTVHVVAEWTTTLHWTMTRHDTPAQTLAAAPAATNSGSSSSIATSSPILPLTSLSLTPGDYTLQVVAENSDGVFSAPTQADVTLVAADLSGIRVWPNPWRQDKHEGLKVTFDQLTGAADVKIFTVSGRLVRDLGNADSAARWDLTTEAGDKVASGVYLYLIQNNLGQQTRGKVSVIR